MSNLCIAVLRGGPSEEHAVSMQTGASVLDAIDQEHFLPRDIVITKNGEWLSGGRTYFPEQLLAQIDGVFVALHGEYGEDGKVQRMLDRFGVPYTGSDAYPSGIAFNKVLTKDHVRDLGILMPPHLVVSRDSKRNTHALAANISELFGPEYVIKPVASGSSVGTMAVKNPALLPQALKDALDVYDQVLVEKRIRGREATCGVVNRFRGAGTYVLPTVEIVPPPHAEFFDSTVKYDGSTEEVCPGRFSRAEKEEIERIARAVHEHLGLAQYSRSDFIVSDKGIYFLEVNTLPGLTAESLFPKALVAVGASHKELVNHLLHDMLEYRKK